MVNKSKNKSKSNMPYAIALGIIIVIFVSSLFIVKIFYKPEQSPQEINHLGLAKLKLIPTVNTCTHNESAYRLTDVGMYDQAGNRYVLLESKFGDEYCPYRIP